jgi:hypothetical protein
VLLTDKPCWLYQAVLACCTNPSNRYHTSQQTAATEHCELHNMLWDICIPVPVCQSVVYHISCTCCVDMVHKTFACSSDHNYRTTSRQLQATELFKLSRLVVVCLRFLWCRSGSGIRVPGCVYVLHEPCACGSNQNSWQTAATAQFELHNTPVIICASRLCSVWSSRTCMLHLTVLTCCTNPVQQVHFTTCRKA